MPNTDPYSASFTVPDRLQVDALSFNGDSLIVGCRLRGSEARCPVCGGASRRVHGHYTRTLADLPRGGVPVCLRVRVRKFFCDESSCERRIFAERLGDVASVHARGTERRRAALEWIAFALGGEAGARLARELGLLVSPDTLLNRIRGASRADVEGVRVLGVDDFGFKRGNASGTILVDLERHKIVDLLRGHSTELIAHWLQQHPGVEVVGRDHSNVCREGIEAGAPEVTQVADRWHLLHNLPQVLEELLLSKRSALKKVALSGTDPVEKGAPEDGAEDPVPTTETLIRRPYETIEAPARKRHERLVEQWKEIRKLHLAGAKVKDISEWIGTSRSTVYRYRQLAEPPPCPEYRRKKSVLDPWMPYLLTRWNEGCHNAKRLYGEIREQGYSHSIDTLNRVLSNFRYTEQQGRKLRAPRAKKGSIAGASPSAKNVAALFMRREEKLNKEQKEYLGKLCASDTVLADARQLTREFAKMVRGLEGEKLNGWLAETSSSEAEVMKKFAAGLEKDLKAVRAGLTESWSTGPVEGFINKLKLLKRQGYGRANLDLLRARALAA